MTVLDEAYERLQHSWLENGQGFVNHGPMACEALFAMGLEDEVVGWADRSARPHRTSSGHRRGGGAITGWWEHLGKFSMLEEWVTHFEVSIEDAGWRDTVAIWVPRLMPSMDTKLFHALIRTAHATRAVDNRDSGPRLHELAFALGYWAARYDDGGRADPRELTTLESDTGTTVDETRANIADTAAAAARRFVTSPDIFTLHGVTGAMAVHLLAAHLSPLAAQASAAQLESLQRELFGGKVEATVGKPVGIDRTTLAVRATQTGDVHAVKLVEAALRGLEATGDPVFALAAETVTDRI